MLVLGEKELSKLAKKQPEARKRLAEWLKLVRETDWTDIEDLKNTYQQADGGVKGIYTVFNIGRAYRIITIIKYEIRTVSVVKACTHKEYDLWSKKM
ncbi:MAG: type II toxin-antitoxin system HigB family toxin [Candidatus Obscuribacterales bacterium]